MNKDYYIGPGIDAAKVHDEANQRMTDARDPASSLVHEHPFGELCKGNQHTFYDAENQTIVPWSIWKGSERAAVVNKEVMGNGVRR